MKKVIKGRVYDTETAQELGTITDMAKAALEAYLAATSKHFHDLADVGPKTDGLSAGQKAMIDDMYDQR